jgi:hypothetical protein
MRRILSTGLLLATVAACAAQPDQSTTTRPANGGEVTLSAVGTPFLIAFKVPVCLVTLVIAGPVAGVASLTDRSSPLGGEVRDGLSDGINQNCGPPYVVSP